MRVLSSAYGPPWEGIQGTGVTATGIDLRKSPHLFIVAVDPKVIPLHTKLTINPNPYGGAAIFSAEDTGSAIKGARIDFYMWQGQGAAREWGMRWVTATVLGAATPNANPAPVTGGAGALPTRPSMEGPPTSAGGSAYDYAFVIRSARRNVQRGGAYLRDAGDAIRRLKR